MSLAQADFQQPCNLRKRSDKQLELKTEKRGNGYILDELHHLENLTISSIYCLTCDQASLIFFVGVGRYA